MIRALLAVSFATIMTLGASVGCSPNTMLPDLGGPSGMVTWSSRDEASIPGIDNGSVYHLGKSFVVWTDLTRGGGASTSSNMHGATCSGELLGMDGKVVKLSCEVDPQGNGTATIAGNSYDLGQGRLFLVSTQGKSPRILQLIRDLNPLTFKMTNLREFAKEDPEIVKFFRNEDVENR